MSSRSVRLKNFKTYFLKLKSDIKLRVELISGLIATSDYLPNGKIVLKKNGEWSTKEQQRSNVKYHVLPTIIVGNNFRVAKCIMHDWHYVANVRLEFHQE